MGMIPHLLSPVGQAASLLGLNAELAPWVFVRHCVEALIMQQTGEPRKCPEAFLSVLANFPDWRRFFLPRLNRSSGKKRGRHAL